MILTRLRSVCLALPEVYEEQAWVGTRWRVRGRTFAHVLTIESGSPRAFAQAAGTDGPATVLTFRSSGPELESLRHAGLLLYDGTDWAEVGELLVESYCVRAPRKLAALVVRPEL